MWAWLQKLFSKAPEQPEKAPEKPIDYLPVALQVTGKFEGSTYSTITGNFDGQGLSAGILQWNLGQGSLQAMLLKYQQDYGIARGAFPEPVEPLCDVTPKEAIALSLKMQDGTKLKPEWEKAWKAFLSTDGMVKIQQDFCRERWNKALELCARWNLKSIRAKCWFFDLVVQNGSLKGVELEPTPARSLSLADPDNAKLWSTMDLNTEQLMLLKASSDRALLSTEAYRRDVFQRKAIIATDKGWLHGAYYDFGLVFHQD